MFVKSLVNTPEPANLSKFQLHFIGLKYMWIIYLHTRWNRLPSMSLLQDVYHFMADLYDPGFPVRA